MPAHSLVNSQFSNNLSVLLDIPNLLARHTLIGLPAGEFSGKGSRQF